MSRVSTRLAAGIRAGQLSSLARAISMIEADDPEGWAIVSELYEDTGRASMVGITGPPGVGKSTLVGALVAVERKVDRSVAVLSVDPSSPFTHGALLGDRVRMSRHYLDDGVFIRSMATRGALGGLAEAALYGAILMDAAGFDTVFLETVGVGQSEIDVVSRVETVVLVLQPRSGDSIQALKAGIMEIPDIVVVNKADGEEANLMVRELSDALAQSSRLDGRPVPTVLKTQAINGEGVEELGAAIRDHRLEITRNGSLSDRRGRNLRNEVVGLAASRLRRRLERLADADQGYEFVLQRVMDRRLDPGRAAQTLIEALAEQREWGCSGIESPIGNERG